MTSPSQVKDHVQIYHEKQSKQLCALHALNNLFQDPQAFKKSDLDAICVELCPESRIFNPHRSAFGLGCYDVNVVISALAKKGYETIWFDKRKDVSSIELDRMFGLILNVRNSPTSGLLAIPFNYIPAQMQVWSSQKHWVAIKKIGQHFYNLDSKLHNPFCIGDDNALTQYLKIKISSEQMEILIVEPKL